MSNKRKAVGAILVYAASVLIGALICGVASLDWAPEYQFIAVAVFFGSAALGLIGLVLWMCELDPNG